MQIKEKELIKGHWCRNFIDSSHSWILKGTNYKWPFIILCFLLFKTLFFNFNIFCSLSLLLQCPFRSSPPPYPLNTKFSFKKQKNPTQIKTPKTILQRIKKSNKIKSKRTQIKALIIWPLYVDQRLLNKSTVLDCLILQNFFSLFCRYMWQSSY